MHTSISVAAVPYAGPSCYAINITNTCGSSVTHIDPWNVSISAESNPGEDLCYVNTSKKIPWPAVLNIAAPNNKTTVIELNGCHSLRNINCTYHLFMGTAKSCQIDVPSYISKKDKGTWFSLNCLVCIDSIRKIDPRPSLLMELSFYQLVACSLNRCSSASCAPRAAAISPFHDGC